MTTEKAEGSNKKRRVTTIDLLGMVPPRVGGEILTYAPNSHEMPLSRMVDLCCLSKNHYTLFQPLLNDAKDAYPLLVNVVQGNPDALKKQVLSNPRNFFKKGQITDHDEQTFYNVSPFQLMFFLCDDDMIRQIMPLIPPMYRFTSDGKEVEIDLEARGKKQYAEIDTGGADLVKMDRDPTKLKFIQVTRFITSLTIEENRSEQIIFPLLENPDGIIYYQNSSTKLEHLYYANQKTQTVTELNPRPSAKDQEALDRLRASLAAMENNSSRRSSNAEHELIARAMQRRLSRKGITYDHNGVIYCDNRIQFRLINNVRKYIRLYQMEAHMEARSYLCPGIGGAQRQVLWVLQRICELDRPFQPKPDFKKSPFRRGFTVYNSDTYNIESVCLDGWEIGCRFRSIFCII
jgi:hypothetical protein